MKTAISTGNVQAPKHEQRTDHWRWFIVESSLKFAQEQGYAPAFEFMLRHKVDQETAKRVLDHPEQRRKPLTWRSRIAA